MLTSLVYMQQVVEEDKTESAAINEAVEKNNPEIQSSYNTPTSSIQKCSCSSKQDQEEETSERDNFKESGRSTTTAVIIYMQSNMNE
jgi:hypothetical protein